MAVSSGPTVHVFDDAKQLGEFAAQLVVQTIEDAVAAGRQPILGLATGSSPIPTYERLIEKLAGSAVDLSVAKTFNLDEYIGLPAEHPESYRSFMFQNLFVPALLSPSNPRGFQQDNIHIPIGTPINTIADLSSEERAIVRESESTERSLTAEEVKAVLEHRAASYEQKLRSQGPVDVQILGIGLNGHIGFNEPGSPIDGPTFATELTESTRQANARFFDGNIDLVPKHAITMGIGSILTARKIVLIATGAAKADIIASTLGMQSPDASVPASALCLHQDVCFLLDRAAAAKLDASAVQQS